MLSSNLSRASYGGDIFGSICQHEQARTAVTLCICIQEVLGLNPCRGTGYTGQDVSRIFSVTTGKYHASTVFSTYFSNHQSSSHPMT
jgi:hypothetical protein